MTAEFNVIIAAAAAAGGAAAAAVGVAWRLRGWLAAQFSASRETFFEAMKSHEDKDQARHEENLERFANIRIALARHGIDNGEGRFTADHH